MNKVIQLSIRSTRDGAGLPSVRKAIYSTLVTGWLVCFHIANVLGAPEVPMRALDVAVPVFGITNAHISEFASLLQQKCNVIISTEDCAEIKYSAFHDLRIDLLTQTTTNLNGILNILVQKFPSFGWHCENGIVILRAAQLSTLKQSPLDRKLKPFRFKGTIQDLRGLISSQSPDLTFAWGEAGRKDMREYDLAFLEETTVRGALTELSRKYGLRWDVLIAMNQTSDPPAPNVTFLISQPSENPPNLINCDAK